MVGVQVIFHVDVAALELAEGVEEVVPLAAKVVKLRRRLQLQSHDGEVDDAAQGGVVVQRLGGDSTRKPLAGVRDYVHDWLVRPTMSQLVTCHSTSIQK